MSFFDPEREAARLRRQEEQEEGRKRFWRWQSALAFMREMSPLSAEHAAHRAVYWADALLEELENASRKAPGMGFKQVLASVKKRKKATRKYTKRAMYGKKVGGKK